MVTLDSALPDTACASGSFWEAAARQLTAAGLLRTHSIWGESRMALELARFHLDPVSSGTGLPAGHGQPVFLIPGYMTGDGSLSPMARALGAAGFRPARAGIRLNVGCAAEMVDPIEARLEAHVAENGGRKAIIIGQSRGGAFGRLLAARRPDLAAGLVTLGTPLLDPLAVNLLVLLNLGVVGALGALGLPGLLSMSCMRPDACCDRVRREMAAPLPAGLPFLSIFSRSDGIVDWRACLAPDAHHVEVDSSHCGMAFNLEVMRAIGAELGRASRG